MDLWRIYRTISTDITLQLGLILSLLDITSARTNLMVTRVGPCYDEARPIVTVSEFDLTTKVYDTSLTGVMNISENIENGWSVKSTMKKCLDMRNLDTCDHFKSFVCVKDGCLEEDDDDEAIYAILFHYVEPRLSCPIEAGSYTITDFPLYTEDNYLTVHESKISTSVFGYTYRLEGFDKLDRKLFCVDAYLQLLYMRDHRWTKSKAKVDIRTTTETASEENGDDE